jgi:hypothetical protein
MARYKIDPYLFDEKEEIVLDSLIVNNTPLEISSDTSLPRSTVYFILDKLKKRGLVKNVYVGKKKKWILRKNDEQIIESKEIKGNSVSTKYFLNNLVKNESLKFKNLNGDFITEGWNKNIGSKDIIKFNKYIGKNNLVSDLISSENSLKTNFEKWGDEWSESFISKPTEYHVINKKYSEHSGQIFLNDERMFLVNMNKSLIIEIKDKEILKMFESIFEFVKDNTKKINVAEFLKNIK